MPAKISSVHRFGYGQGKFCYFVKWKNGDELKNRKIRLSIISFEAQKSTKSIEIDSGYTFLPKEHSYK